MKLEVGTFPVRDIVFAGQTRWTGGVLEINRDELMAVISEDPMVGWADVTVVRPGDPTRIVDMHDVIQPKVKVSGPGVAYPGIADRPVDTVGQGRTHCLGMTIVPCGETPYVDAHGSDWWGKSETDFVDMAGPGAVTPFARTVNLCLTMEPHPGAHAEDWTRVLRSAMLRANDLLAGTVADLTPPELRTYDLDNRGADLPKVVFVPVLASAEHRFGPRTSLGTAIYGVGRLTQPWLLQPTELMDGAVCGAYQENFTWPILETIVPHLAARHGVDLNFAGCIVVRSNWESQAEKQLMANRAAQMAADIGAQGAIVTTNVRGQRFLETILTVQALERAGIGAVLMTEEEDNEGGPAPPLLVSAPEVASVVSTGTGGVVSAFPKVERVIGPREPSPRWFEERPAIHGRYGVSHLHDFYGFGSQGYLDF